MVEKDAFYLRQAELIIYQLAYKHIHLVRLYAKTMVSYLLRVLRTCISHPPRAPHVCVQYRLFGLSSAFSGTRVACAEPLEAMVLGNRDDIGAAVGDSGDVETESDCVV